MIFTYHPEGQDEPQTWALDLGKIKVGEMEAIEKRTGLRFGTEFRAALMMAGASARRAMLWTLLRRTHHTLRYEDVDFANDEVKLEMDRDEWEVVRQQVIANKAITEDERAERLEAIDTASADAPEPPGKSPTPSAKSGESTD